MHDPLRALSCLLSTTSLVALASHARAAPTGEPPAPNTIHAEAAVFGPLMLSLNYERRIVPDVGLRGGLGAFEYNTFAPFPESGEATTSYIAAPLTVSFVGLRGLRSALELGAGTIVAIRTHCQRTSWSTVCGAPFRPFASAFIGYRRHPIGWGYNFRVGLMMLAGSGVSSRGGDLTIDYEFDRSKKVGVIPALYMSLGGSF